MKGKIRRRHTAEFKQLSEIDMADIMKLMNHPMVRRHMPLLVGQFDQSKYKSFIAAKEKTWEEKGYGPWAFTLNGIFIGWGGLQPVDHDVEIALVLHPNYWGQGKAIYDKIIKYAFEDQGLESVIVLFPPSRMQIKGILRLGFKVDGEYEFSGKQYIRYRLYASEMHKKG